MLITEQVPDERVSWAWTEKSQHFATITFSRLDNDHTRVSAELELDTELKEMWRTLPGEAGIPSNRLNDYLRRFRDFAEGDDSGANQ